MPLSASAISASPDFLADDSGVAVLNTAFWVF
jgi:hypothetical protein